MSKKTKNLFILITLISFLFLSACQSEIIDEKTNLKTTVALLEEKLSDKDEYDLLFNINNEVLKLKVDEKNILENIKDNEIYTIAYDSNTNTLKSLSPYDFEYANEPEIEYAKDEPDVGKAGKPILISKGDFDSEELTLVDSFEYEFLNEEENDDENDILENTEPESTDINSETDDSEENSTENDDETKAEEDNNTDVDTENNEISSKISLYTTAEKDDNGDLMLDDGQQWTLVAETKNGHFILFDDYIQIGQLDFKVLTKNNDFSIITIQDDVASLQVTEFLFDQKNKTFVPYKRYVTDGDVNILY